MAQSGRYNPPPTQEIVYGKDVASVLAEELERRQAKRVVLITNTSLTGAGGLAEMVEGALGSARAAVVSGVRAHSPREDVIRMPRVHVVGRDKLADQHGKINDSEDRARPHRQLVLLEPDPHHTPLRRHVDALLFRRQRLGDMRIERLVGNPVLQALVSEIATAGRS